MQNDISYFARTNFRNQNQLFGIRQADRAFHMAILGATGTGKSTLLKTFMTGDIQAGRGFAFLDPHGDACREIFETVPEERKADVIYFDVADPKLNLKYTPFRKVSIEKRSLVASGLLDTFRKLWANSWGAKLEHILRYSILTLLDQPSATMEDLYRLLLDKSYRTQAMQHITSDSTKMFWQREFGAYLKTDLLPVLNKVGAMLSHPVVKRVLCTNKEEVSLRAAMDSGKIVLINLNRGMVGSDVAEILGGFLLASIANAGYSRADTPTELRRPFQVYLDEAGLFTTDSLATMLAEIRKYGLCLTFSAQYIEQFSPTVATALLANVGTLIAFRVGVEDAKVLRLKMDLVFDVQDFVSLPNYHIYLKLMIDASPSKAFSACL